VGTDLDTGEKVWETKSGESAQWEEGADYQYIGYGDESEDWVVDENGNGHLETYKAKYQYVEYGVDEDGNPVVNKYGETSTTPIQFALQDDEGNIVYGYCVDLDTYTTNGAYYNVDNLERGTYYATKEAENHIRAIVKNGYWGTKEGTGSLAQIKDMLKADESFALSDKEIDALTEGEALAVTQSAIWTFANGSTQEGIDDGKTGNRVTGVTGKDNESTARMEALYSYLIGLSEPADQNTATEIINEDHFVKDLQLRVGELAENREENADENDKNDVYQVEIDFTMEVIPDPVNDDLIIKIVDSNDPDKVLSAARIAGENKEGEDQFEILHSSSGKYTLTGMTMSENQKYNVKLVIEGTQKLEQGVYIYSPTGGTKYSQTFVGLAEGTKGVNVAMNMEFQFNVEDTARVVERRAWYEEDPHEIIPSNPSETPEENTKNENQEKEQLEELPEEEVPLGDLTEIMEEDVPLANVPMTGDNSLFFIGMTVLSGSGLAGLALTRKKEDEE